MIGLSKSGAHALRVFAGITGHRAVARALRERVLQPRSGQGLLLHGPMHAGKRTLARLYAKAIHCEAPTDAGDSCDACESCAAFEISNTGACVLQDARRVHADVLAAQIAAHARSYSLFDRRVIAIVNVDDYRTATLDRFLKPLEGGSVPFILTACDLSQVRPAVLSRCMPLRVRALDDGDARALTKAFLPAHAAPWDAKVIDVLVAAGQGLPGKIEAITHQLADAPDLSLAGVRARLNLDWVDAVAALWCRTLDLRGSGDEILSNTAAEPTRQLRCLRLTLLQARTLMLKSMPHARIMDAAFLHRDLAPVAAIGAALERWAQARGMAAEALWGDLLRLWSRDDHADTFGVAEALRASRSVVIGERSS